MKANRIFLFILFSYSGLFVIAQTPSLTLTPFTSGFIKPIDIGHCGDSRLFVAELGGKIFAVDSNGIKSSSAFLNISLEVDTSDSEQGLLGFAFHPDYINNGFFYVNYITGSGAGYSRISRFKVDAGNPNHADSTSEVILLSFKQPFTNHNGGCLKFGPDGYLYNSQGDGGNPTGNEGDPGNRAQQTDSLFGKILRIDVDHGNPYGIPPDNPFASGGGRPEIWAYGLRNPWRFSFDKLTGDLWIADVGQTALEEINYQPANDTGGENYGWHCYEGTLPFPSGVGDCNGTAGLTLPVYEYGHSKPCTSVTGGFVYRGLKYPNLYGKYFFTDFCLGNIEILEPNGSSGFTHTDLGVYDKLNYTSFGEDVKGELYLAELDKGLIMKIGAYPDEVESIYDKNTIQIFPNPSDGKIQVNGILNHSGKVNLKIFNAVGQLIIKNEMNPANEFSLDLTGNPPGIYILKLISEKEIYTAKIFIKG